VFLGNFLGQPQRVTFGGLTLDLDTRQLRQGDDPVHLSRKAYELLCVLVGARPRAIAKRELHDRLWPSTFVSDATLASLVAELRQALGDRGEPTTRIRTVHGFGYAFDGGADGVASTAVAARRHWIICNGREHPLTDGENLIGRESGAAVTLSAPGVSRRHARVVLADDVMTVEDLGSKNGTFVRGQALTAPLVVVDGDRIRVGSFELTIRTLTDAGSTETSS
jgi:DNA-binding winged helix-turn-helix (wHTH) protein